MPDTHDPRLAIAGLLIGILVGMTGMGGGSLMTPMLILFFKFDPAAWGIVHRFRRRTPSPSYGRASPGERSPRARRARTPTGGRSGTNL
jgi:hypothetical protein